MLAASGLASVSIHAPRCWGANGRRPSCPCGSRASFNPRPPLLGGECSASRATASASFTFQSTPPVAGGRMPWCGRNTGAPGMFQSTPPVAGGRMFLANTNSAISTRVSIHAPRCWGANDRPKTRAMVRNSVSIHAPRCWGANAFLSNLRKAKRNRVALREPRVFAQRVSYINPESWNYRRQINVLPPARSCRVKVAYLGFAGHHSTRGASKSVARKQPYSFTS